MLTLSLILACLISWMGLSYGHRALPAGVELIGRFDSDLRSTWPGSGLQFEVTVINIKDPLTITVNFANCDVNNCNFYVGVFVDGHQQPDKYLISPSKTSIRFNSLTGQRKNTFKFVKLTESSQGDAHGIMQFDSLTVTNAEITTSSSQRTKMLVIGDSISAAYGVDGSMPCTFSAKTEDVTHGYAMLVAQALQPVDIHVVAWSGRGVVRNYGDANTVSTEPMPVLYNRTIATQSTNDNAGNYWNPQLFQPNIVVITLGTNDFSTNPQPSEEEFVGGYLNFLDRIHSDYPSVPVLVICAPINTGPQCQYTEKAAQETKPAATYLAVPPSTLSSGYGCDYHPNRGSQQAIADVVTPVVKSILQV